MKSLKIFCLTCKEYILETSDEFVCGGPYHGAMFEGATADKWAATLFKLHETVKGGDLFCPRCMGPFIVAGRLLTEHGVIQPGQTSIDTSFNIVHQEGHAKGMLMYVKDSFAKPASAMSFPRQNGKKPVLTFSGVKKPKPKKAPVKDNKALLESDPGYVERLKVMKDDLKCRKCGRQYKDPRWRDRHEKKCKG